MVRQKDRKRPEHATSTSMQGLKLYLRVYGFFLFSLRRFYIMCDFRQSFHVDRVQFLLQCRVMDGVYSVEGMRQRVRDLEQLVERQHDELVKKVRATYRPRPAK